MITHEKSVHIHDVPQEARTSGSLTPGACDAHRLENTLETQSGPDIRPLQTNTLVSRGYLSAIAHSVNMCVSSTDFTLNMLAIRSCCHNIPRIEATQWLE